MRYLIDGHNLIGHLPELSLSDPDDEAKLVALLHVYCLRAGHRCTVIFDRGLPGGRSRELSTSRVEAHFAHAGTDADAILKARIRRVRDPGGWTFVSSDAAIRETAHRRGMAALTSPEFGIRLRGAASAPTDDAKPLPSPHDTDYWMEQFPHPPEDE